MFFQQLLSSPLITGANRMLNRLRHKPLLLTPETCSPVQFRLFVRKIEIELPEKEVYSSLESVIEQSKEQYYLALRQTQVTIRSESPDWQPWLVYFLRSLMAQKDSLERKIRRERLILGNLPELSQQLLEICRERGRLTVAEASAATGRNRNTIKDHIKVLTEAGHLTRHGAGRGTWYSLGQ